MKAGPYLQYLAAEWEMFVGHRDRRDSAELIRRRINPIDRVLDIGCGAGQELLSYLPDAFCVGLDLSEKAGPYAQQQLRGVDEDARTAFVRARAEALPLRDGQFDLVTCRLVLPYTNVPNALLDVGRVLRPGGGFFVQVQSVRQYLRQLGRSATQRDRRTFGCTLNVLRTGTNLRLLGRQRGPETFLSMTGLRRLARAVRLEFVMQIRNDNSYAPQFLFKRGQEQ